MVKLVDVIISIILGIILNYFVTSEIIAYSDPKSIISEI